MVSVVRSMGDGCLEKAIDGSIDEHSSVIPCCLEHELPPLAREAAEALSL